MLLQKCYCLLTGDAVIEFDAEYAFFKFTVMNDSDVLNAECIRSEDGRNGGDHTGFIRDVTVDLECTLDRAGRTVWHGIAVVPGMVEHIVDSLGVSGINQFFASFNVSI